MKSPKVALIYDRVNTPYGGAEQVLMALHHLYPDAPLFTSVYDPERASWTKSWIVIPSFLQHFPWAKKLHRWYVGLMPLAFESFKLTQYDIIISITSAEAKGVLTQPHQLHVCYLLTPTRYLWSHPEEYRLPAGLDWIRQGVFRYLKWWDEAAAFRPDEYITISERVSARLKKYYHQHVAKVITPPVTLLAETQKVTVALPPKPYYLVVARLVKYKKIDVAIRGCAQAGRNLVIIGEGPELEALQLLAQELEAKAPNRTWKILFLQAVQPAVCAAYYRGCSAFLAPGEEDFGIASMEAQLYGKPVIIHHQSGAAELIEDGKTGVHLFEASAHAVAEAIHFVEADDWSSAIMSKRAQQYSTEHFQKVFRETIEKLWQKKQLDRR